MDAGEQLAGVKAASFTAAGAGTSEYVYCPGMDVDKTCFTANRKAFGLTWEGGRALRRRGPGDISGGRPREGGQGSGRALGRRAALALWPSAAKGGEICFTARGMLHIAGGLVAALKHRGAGGDGGIRLALTDGGKAAMRAAHVVLCGASDVSCKATLRAGYEFSNLPTAGGSTAVATGGGGPSNSPTCREPAEVATEIKAMGSDDWQVRAILRAERQNVVWRSARRIEPPRVMMIAIKLVFDDQWLSPPSAHPSYRRCGRTLS
jgi:hypothetical protein